MGKTIANTARALIGLDKFHFSVMYLDHQDLLVYGDMISVPETIELNVNTNSQASVLFADNKPAIAYTTIGVVEVSMTKATLPNEFLAILLGNRKVGGVRHITSDQNSPYVGIAWRQLYSDGSYAYVKLFKGKFMEPENNSRTKEDGVEFQTREIMANFIATSFQETDDNTEKFSLLMATTDETDPNYTDEGLTWFDYIIAPMYTAWVTATVYKVNDAVSNGGNIYRCITAHTASATFATDSTKWELLGAAPTA